MALRARPDRREPDLTDRSQWTEDDWRFYRSIRDPGPPTAQTLGPSVGDDPEPGRWGWRLLGVYAILQWIGCALFVVILVVGIILSIPIWLHGGH
jgi:hypothetical protein